MRTVKNRFGQRFGKLIIVERVESKLPRAIRWRCLCDCGNYVERYSGSLYSGETTHCGCNHANKVKSIKHGQRKILSKTYNTWRNMLSRCRYKKDKAYRWYGAKGIKVDKKWNTYLGFLEDMGERPEGMTLDRIDSNGNYCKDNYRWATAKQQANNRVYKRKLDLKMDS